MGAGEAKACVLRKVTWKHHQSLGSPGMWTISDLQVWWREWSPKTCRSGAEPYYHCTLLSWNWPTLWALWVPKAVITWILPSHGHYSYVEAQNYWSCQHHELLNPGFTWYLWTCCNYGHVVDPALQVTRALWIPKPCPPCGLFLSQGPC